MDKVPCWSEGACGEDPALRHEECPLEVPRCSPSRPPAQWEEFPGGKGPIIVPRVTLPCPSTLYDSYDMQGGRHRKAELLQKWGGPGLGFCGSGLDWDSACLTAPSDAHAAGPGAVGEPTISWDTIQISSRARGCSQVQQCSG